MTAKDMTGGALWATSNAVRERDKELIEFFEKLPSSRATEVRTMARRATALASTWTSSRG